MKVSANTKGTPDHKLYKRRWFMLFLFMLYVFNGSQQWAQFTIISNLVTKYYNVTTTQVEWTANIFTLSFILMVLPSIYLIDLLGVRYTMILAALGITIGTWIKAFSVAPDRFHIAFLGQLCAVPFIMLAFGLLGRFTATWFGTHEISTAGVLVMLGDQFGVAFAYFFPTAVVKDGSEEFIGKGLRNMHLCVAISSTVILLLVIFFFQATPKLPASIAQIKQKQTKKEKVLPTLYKLIKKPPYVLYLISYGFNCGFFFGLATCLNEIIITNFPEGLNDAGNIGCLMMISGMISSLIVGKVLDKTRKFKECAVVLTSCATISLIMFTWSLKSGNILYVYISAGLFGFWVWGYYSGGIQLAIELTFPIQEEISTAISFLSCMISCFTMAIVYSYLIKNYGDLKANLVVVGLYIVTTIVTFCIPVDLKRQKAENEPHLKSSELKEFI